MSEMSKLQLTLEQKIGQMVMCGFATTEVNDNIRSLIKEYHVGGIIYFRRNVESKEQVSALSHQLQEISREQTNIPLFISIDQEGGMVARIDWDDITLIPGNMTIGATRSAEHAYQAAHICGEELLRLGINMNFAPSLDVNNNPENPVIGVRSYSERPDLVAELGTAQIRGLQEANVAATAKHFPGHGDTAVDSHHGLAAVPHDEERLVAVELAPFVQAIREGVDCIMTAHVIFPAFEPNAIPATLSYNVLTKLLRQRLGYHGLIVTDCLEMHAISKEVGVAEGAVRAVEAGADILLVSHTYEEQVASIQALCEAVRSGRIAESRIDESIDRIITLKNKRHMGENSEVAADFFAYLGTPESKASVDQMFEDSTTLVKDDAGALPLDRSAKTLVIWPQVRTRSEVDDLIVQEYTLVSALEPHMQHVEILRINNDPEPFEVNEILANTEGYSQIVVLTYNPVSKLHQGQVDVVNALLARSSIRVVVASTRNPYDLNQFPDAPTYLCCYENRPAAMKALGNVLLGITEPKGKLPVTISEQYSFGHSASFCNK